MAEDQDDSQKTEDPTQKRLDDALKKGQVSNSREVASFFVLGAFTFVIIWLAPGLMRDVANTFSHYIESAHLYPMDSGSIMHFSVRLFKEVIAILILPFLIVIGAIFTSAMIQNGFMFVFDPIMPQLSRISPLQGFKRIFSMKSLVEFLKGIIKIALVASVVALAVYPNVSRIEQLFGYSVPAVLVVLGELAVRVLIGVMALMLIIAVLDYLYQKFEHTKSLRMSRRDIKDELKQTEGNPEIKAKLRELRRERAQNRMMQDVPDADVVVTNPTHYAVALQYKEKEMTAPKVVAKGQDFIALKIREVAEANDVPVVENPPLARTLYSAVEINEEIPVTHFKAVAEVIRYVYELKGKIPKRKRTGT